jgi:hypothetical protein
MNKGFTRIALLSALALGVFGVTGCSSGNSPDEPDKYSSSPPPVKDDPAIANMGGAEAPKKGPKKGGG